MHLQTRILRLKWQQLLQLHIDLYRYFILILSIPADEFTIFEKVGYSLNTETNISALEKNLQIITITIKKKKKKQYYAISNMLSKSSKAKPTEKNIQLYQTRYLALQKSKQPRIKKKKSKNKNKTTATTTNKKKM